MIESAQAVLIDGHHVIGDHMHVEPAPGHTPGHVILKFDGRAGKAVFCGDVVHHPIQVHEPDWNTRFCELPNEARATRRRMLDYCAEYGATLFPMHFAAPDVASILDADGGFAVRFENP